MIDLRVVCQLIVAFLAASAVAQQKPAADEMARWQTFFARPAVLPAPPDNPLTAAKVRLGARLFREQALSADGTKSCASCHAPSHGLADGRRYGVGVTGKPLERHTPSLWNLAWAPALFWDGRAKTLEEQALYPIEHPDEMGSSLALIIDRIGADASYKRLFAAAFPADPAPTGGNLLKALAAYERTLVSPPTRFDRWLAGDTNALSPAERRGFDLFTGKAFCIACHRGFAFTDYDFHNIGLITGDLGRGPVSGTAKANHAFKTPTLRELKWTAPYFHDGSQATLAEVVAHYAKAGLRRPWNTLESSVFPAEEQADLVAFLLSLSSDRQPEPSRERWIRK